MGCLMMFLPPPASRSSAHTGRSVFHLQPSHPCTPPLHPVFLWERVEGYAFRSCALDVSSTHHTPHLPNPPSYTDCSPRLFPNLVTLLRPSEARGDGAGGRIYPNIERPVRRRSERTERKDEGLLVQYSFSSSVCCLIRSVWGTLSGSPRCSVT